MTIHFQRLFEHHNIRLIGIFMFVLYLYVRYIYIVSQMKMVIEVNLIYLSRQYVYIICCYVCMGDACACVYVCVGHLSLEWSLNFYIVIVWSIQI